MPANNLHTQLNSLTDQLFCTTSDPNPRSCLLEALGTFLTEIVGVFSQFSISLTNGPHVFDYAENYIRTVIEANDLSDTSVVAHLDQKLSLLTSVL